MRHAHGRVCASSRFPNPAFNGQCRTLLTLCRSSCRSRRAPAAKLLSTRLRPLELWRRELRRPQAVRRCRGDVFGSARGLVYWSSTRARLALCARCRADTRLPALAFARVATRKSSMRRTASTATPLACSLWAAPRPLTALCGLRGAISKRATGAVAGWPTADAGEVITTLENVVGKVTRLRRSAWLRRAARVRKQRTHDGRYWSAARAPTAPNTRGSLEPVTGRPHQLRLHMLHEGHPILGDELHADCDEAVRAGQGRLCLHAAALTFEHPTQRGQVVSVESSAPF